MKPGTYHGHGLEGSVSQRGDFVEVEVEFTDSPRPGERMKWYGRFKSEAQAKFTMVALGRFGYEGGLDGIRPKAKLPGVDKNEVELVVAVDDYNNKLKIQYVNQIGGSGKSSGNGAAQLARFKKAAEDAAAQVAAERQEVPPPPAHKVERTSTGSESSSGGSYEDGDPGASEDDIPF